MRLVLALLWLLAVAFMALAIITAANSKSEPAEPYSPFDLFGPPEPNTPCIYLPGPDHWMCPAGVTPPEGAA
jgi:hypothetical protein